MLDQLGIGAIGQELHQPHRAGHQQAIDPRLPLFLQVGFESFDVQRVVLAKRGENGGNYERSFGCHFGHVEIGYGANALPARGESEIGCHSTFVTSATQNLLTKRSLADEGNLPHSSHFPRHYGGLNSETAIWEFCAGEVGRSEE